MSDQMSAPIEISFSETEKRRLAQLAALSGQTLAEYIRERVLAELRCEEQVLRFLSGELAAIARDAKEAIAAPVHATPPQSAETLQVQRERIVKEVRDSLTDAEIEALAQFFKPVFEAGLWPVP